MLAARPSRDFMLGGVTSLLAGLAVFSMTRLAVDRGASPPELPTLAAVLKASDAYSEPESPRKRMLDQTLEELDVQFGPAFFERSVSHAGTCSRLKEVLERARKGELISIAAVGGSVTAGFGPPYQGRDQTWTHSFAKVWNETFPHPAFEMHVGAVPGRGSSFFHMTVADYLPSAPPDLVIMDQAVNDGKSDEEMATYDLLLRAVLGMPSRPAVIQLEFMRMTKEIPVGGNGGGNQLDVARYLDVPSISIRNPLLPAMIAHPERIPLFYGEGWRSVDPLHPGLRAHYAAAKALQHFIVTLLLKMDDKILAERSARVAMRRAARLAAIPAAPEDPSISIQERLWNNINFKYSEEQLRVWKADLTSHLDEVRFTLEPDELAAQVPRLALTDNFHDPRAVTPPHPVRAALTGTHRILTPSSSTLGSKVVGGQETEGPGEGWSIKKLKPDDSDGATYLFSDSPGALVSFDLPRLGLGEVRLEYRRSKTLGLGTLRCWIDGDETDADGTSLAGNWDSGDEADVISTVKRGVSAGEGHSLLCKLLSGSFLISSVITL